MAAAFLFNKTWGRQRRISFLVESGLGRGEGRENVCENYRRYCESIGADHQKLVLSDQVHETTVKYVDPNFCAGANIEKKLKAVDGMLTDIPELLLATSYADCVPLFFCDPKKRSSHPRIPAGKERLQGSVR